jgi:hypothetical protein
MILPVAKGEVTSEHNNQSIPGLTHRLLTHAPSFSTYENNQKVGRSTTTSPISTRAWPA